MKLLIVLLCLGIQRYLNIRFSLCELNWFKPYRALITKTLGEGLMKGYIGLVILVLPVALLVWLLNWMLGGNFVIGLIIGSVVLFHCLDARDIAGQIPNYLKGSTDGVHDELKALIKEPVPQSPQERARAVSSKILLRSQHHVFSVLFWYMFLGVFGAIAYYLVHSLSHDAAKKDSDALPYADASQLVETLMDWIPVRLAGIAYGAVGAFGALLAQLTKHLVGGLESERKLPVIFGLSAINADVENSDKATVEENQSLLALVFKAELVWIVGIALIAIISLI